MTLDNNIRCVMLYAVFFVAAGVDAPFNGYLCAFFQVLPGKFPGLAPCNAVDKIRFRLPFLLELAVNSQAIGSDSLAGLRISDFGVSYKAADQNDLIR